jgi:hypothetical protein
MRALTPLTMSLASAKNLLRASNAKNCPDAPEERLFLGLSILGMRILEENRLVRFSLLILFSVFRVHAIDPDRRNDSGTRSSRLLRRSLLCRLLAHFVATSCQPKIATS